MFGESLEEEDEPLLNAAKQEIYTSELSIIAHDYALNAEFAKNFNQAVMNLKRRYLLGRTSKGGDGDAIEKSREEIRRLVGSLVAGLEGADRPWTEDQAQIPTDVLEALRKRLKGELPKKTAELRRVAANLARGATLDQAAFVVLDRVCEAADATASAAFRRLRRI
jgi:hypothetical protein